MSTTEIAEPTTLLCPSCSGKIEAAQTICDACRSAMEEQVMAVRAADYPRLFENAAENPAETPRNPIDPARMDMLKIADETDDLDLVPLVPIDESRKGGAEADGAVPSSSASTAAVSSAMAVAIPMASYPVSGQSGRPGEPPGPGGARVRGIPQAGAHQSLEACDHCRGMCGGGGHSGDGVVVGSRAAPRGRWQN